MMKCYLPPLTKVFNTTQDWNDSRFTVSDLKLYATETVILNQQFKNSTISQAIDALEYLARNDRPEYGQSQYNTEHLLQIADELKQHFKDETI